MKFSKCFQLAFNSIISNKMRSFLTMLGIIIGITAVITLVSVMNGITGQVTDMFEKMGTTTINVTIKDRGGSRAIRPKDVYSFAKENKDLISVVSPSVSVNATVKNRTDSDSITTKVSGVSEAYGKMNKLETTEGSFFQYVDVERLQNVCVIGTYIQSNFYGKTSSLGESLKINGVAYTIIGILEEQADTTKGSSDECIYIPYTNAAKLTGNATVNNYIISAKSEELVDKAIKEIKMYLNNVSGDSDFYNVMGMKELLDKMSSITGTLNLALVFIAGISLLVGGIGIMNIMLVSVTERTREIGVRKSLGANPRDIMRQFVIEAATVSGLGGIIGIILGVSLSILVGKIMDINSTPSINAIMLAFGVSAGIGIAFGYLPAKKASALNPIDALRFE